MNRGNRGSERINHRIWKEILVFKRRPGRDLNLFGFLVKKYKKVPRPTKDNEFYC
jgi:hypothetical protein